LFVVFDSIGDLKIFNNEKQILLFFLLVILK